ncbi:unnamed protein product (macronuclear) [Paramecium tetraurelia]|uniref:Uncharacterized protein n=1 Tax=Paramecium tetraurelia TaxID=5888 RepID=A0D046_PARTE|nr:uncharacterized protein GSPATT00011965001 [Paramecium tetraurelia]CAK76413.1 unnamed protein product [Paramecium tetraurelia]|eukprot:XP_001443810.1 hypothetical protein (macronuclear) [Paramecium tetraurelia strain d4-2]
MLVNYSDSEDDQKQNDNPVVNNIPPQEQIKPTKLIPIEPSIVKKRKPNPKECKIPDVFLKSDGKIDQEINQQVGQQQSQGNKFIPRQLLCKKSNVSIE